MSEADFHYHDRFHVFNSRAYEDDAPVRRCIQALIKRLGSNPDSKITLRRTHCGLSLECSDGFREEQFVGLDMAEQIQMRLRVIANIDVLHPGLVHGQYELVGGSENEARILSVRSNRTPTIDEVSITLDTFGCEPFADGR